MTRGEVNREDNYTFETARIRLHQKESDTDIRINQEVLIY